MGLFTKKINEKVAKDFFTMSYTKLIADKEMATHIGQLQQLKEVFPLLEDVKQEVFDENLTAVNLQWLDAAWTHYYLSKGISFSDGIDITIKIQTGAETLVPGVKKYDDLKTLYNQAFGSSSTDGNTAVAEVFVSHIIDDYETRVTQESEEIRQVILGISTLFVGTFDLYTDIIKRYRLVR